MKRAVVLKGTIQNKRPTSEPEYVVLIGDEQLLVLHNIPDDPTECVGGQVVVRRVDDKERIH